MTPGSCDLAAVGALQAIRMKLQWRRYYCSGGGVMGTDGATLRGISLKRLSDIRLIRLAATGLWAHASGVYQYAFSIIFILVINIRLSCKFANIPVSAAPEIIATRPALLVRTATPYSA